MEEEVDHEEACTYMDHPTLHCYSNHQMVVVVVAMVVQRQ